MMGTAIIEPLARVAKRVGLSPLAARLAAIRAWLADDLAELEAAILLGTNAAEIGDSADLADQAGRYLLSRPGKRIRPLCVILGARMGGRTLDRPVRDLAVACELVHTATLLHDDVIDQGAERRGAPAARVVYGNAASVLAGDHLLLHALRLVEGVGYRTLLGGLLDTMTQMVTAEAIQLEQRGRFEPSREAYLEVIQGKTAALFRWALAAGGTVGGVDDEAVAALARTGNALGLAFQLADDLLDLAGDPALAGKDLLADLREGKLTWPFIIAADEDPRVLAAARDFVEGRSESARETLDLLMATGAIGETKRFALAQADLARQALRALPAGPARRAIEVVIDAAVRRTR